MLEPHPASIQDRDGGGPLLRVSRRMFPFIQRVFADSGYAGEKVTTATLIAVEIVRKNPDQIGFAVNPRRWVVERFFAWIGRNRRLAKDFEATIDFSTRLPLRRIHHAARASDRSCYMTFETDFKVHPRQMRTSGKKILLHISREAQDDLGAGFHKAHIRRRDRSQAHIATALAILFQQLAAPAGRE